MHNVTVPCGPLGPVIEHVFGGKLDLPGEFLFSGRRRCRKLVLDTIDFSRVQIDILMDD